MKAIYGLAYLLLIAEVAAAKPLPPLGKRKYLLDLKHPERTAEIEGIDAPASDVEAPVMKDPIPLGQPSSRKVKTWTEPARVVSKSSKLKFEKVAVSGRYSVPRVSLEPERKEIKHADEPVKQNYLKKAQESDQILKDLNW